MEARQTLRGSSVPKGLVVLLAVCATVALAVAGSMVSKNFAGSGAAQSGTVHAAPGTVLRQDAGSAPSLLDRGSEQTSRTAPAAIHGTRGSGSQSIEDGAAAPAAPAQTAEPNYGFTHGHRYI